MSPRYELVARFLVRNSPCDHRACGKPYGVSQVLPFLCYLVDSLAAIDQLRCNVSPPHLVTNISSSSRLSTTTMMTTAAATVNGIQIQSHLSFVNGKPGLPRVSFPPCATTSRPSSPSRETGYAGVLRRRHNLHGNRRVALLERSARM